MRNLAEIQKRIENGTMPLPVKSQYRCPPTRQVIFKGFKCKLYSVSWLARMLNRRVDTVRGWERQLVLPRPLLNFEDHFYRWYSAAEVLGYTQVYAGCPHCLNGRVDLYTFKKRAIDFHIKLRHIIEKDPTQLLTSFPQETTLREIFMHNRNVIMLRSGAFKS